jgi:hypothetical protein
VDADVPLVTSHNTTLASAARVEWIEPGAQSCAGAEGFFRFERQDHIQTFREFEWKTDLGWNQNRNLFRLVDGGLLHRATADAGVTVTDGAPHARDVALLDDWENDPRPAGDPLRTDRGMDQFRQLIAGDLQVILPGIPVFSGASVGSNGAEDFEIVAVGPQDDLPGFEGEAMSGGEFRVSGDFVSIIDTISNPNLPRGTRFDGSPNAFVEFPSMIWFDGTIALTIEAWVFREDTNRVETILSHNGDRSFWFGFNGPRLRFQRAPGQQADSDRPVSRRRWTHVAMAYDGFRASFFIDGSPAGSALLGLGVARIDEALRLGGDAAGLNFRGVLDEVRLWSVVRSAADIRASMFQEVGRAPGLAAAFPSGGAYEGILGLPGQPGPGAVDDPLGAIRPTLEIPRALGEISVDGEVHLDTEYLGAEQVAISYDDGPDAIAYLVHRDEPGDQNLYVAITGLRDVPAGRERSNSWVAIGLDPNGSRNDLATAFDPQFRGYLDAARGQMYLGDGLGGFNYFDMWPSPDDEWDVAYDFPLDLAPATMEFRIAKSDTWSWSEPNGLMLGHFDVAAPSDNYVAPNGCVWNSPATWPVVFYVENSTVLPIAIVDGHVFDNDQAHPMVNHRVFLKIDQTGELRATERTDADGFFRFRASVPPDEPLRLEIDACPNCLYVRSGIYDNNIQPISSFPSLVIYPAAEPGTNRYARVNFYLRQPIGPIALTSYAPTSGVPRLILREEPLKMIPEDVATRVTISGANLHQQIQVYLFGCDFLNEQTGPQPLLDCLPNRDYYEARIVDRAADDTWVEVEVPHVPRSTYNNQWNHEWSWVVRDNWDRPQRAGVVWTRVGGIWPDTFRLRLPPLPLVSGFQFDNDEFGATWSDFEGVYGDNRFFCLFDECACGVPDAGYWPWFLVWLGLMDSTGGACNGMSATSLQFYRLDLDAEAPDMNPDANASGIHFANGFTRRGSPVRTIDADAEPESQCSYNKPVNLAAHIRVNHGIQFTEEYLQPVLDQLVGAGDSIEGDPDFVLECVTNGSGGYVISMVPEIGKGHVVTPYAVLNGVNGDDELDPESWKILVYDNNHPEDTNRFIEITPGSYRFPRADNITDPDTRWDGHWEGQGIYAIPISVFHRFSCSHSMPGAGQALEFIDQVVFGGADGYYTDGAGGEWGWRADGTWVDHLPGARSFTPVGGRNTSTRSVMLFVPVTNPPPAVQINVRSNHYTFHAAHAGRSLQIERRDGVPGDTDHVTVLLETGRVASVRYTPQHQASDFNVRAMLTPGARQRVVFELAGVTIPANAGGEFRILNEARGLEFRNDTGSPVQPLIAARWSDGASGRYGTSQFGPFDVPAGAVQQVFVQDWPVASQLRSEIDLDRDGTVDQVQIVSANPPPLLSLQATLATNQIIVSWPRTTLDVYLEVTPSLTSPVPWTAVDDVPEVIGATMRVTLPASDQRTFFRLRY